MVNKMININNMALLYKTAIRRTPPNYHHLLMLSHPYINNKPREIPIVISIC